ncbi:sigma-70 family RNA polymerase sigma factor [Candidatus Poribacteria bacterium]|nr:sigma-70 family RNA polymerase sigma factor [Candidatus Poribacteria bacterium]
MTLAMSHSPEPDPDLRRRFHAGDPAAIDELAAQFFEDVARFAMALVKEPELAGEAVQETFLRVLERHQLYDAARPFRPWLFMVCRNCCLGLLRDRSRQRARVVELDPAEDEAAALAAGVPPAFEEMIRREREGEALEALAGVPDSAREIVVLHLFEELTFKDIAAIVGRPPATAATIYYRTLSALRGQLTARARRSSGHAG